VSDAILRRRIAEAIAADPNVGGDAMKRIVNDRRHRVIELWAEEKAKQLGLFNTAPASPESVVQVCDLEFEAKGRSYKPRWELVAAIVFGDATDRSRSESRRLYECARGQGSARQRYVGRGSPPGPHRRPPYPSG
jgi:hypothetical protein